MTAYLLLFFIFQTNQIQVVEFSSMASCQKAGQALMDEFDDKDENGIVIDHNSFYHCVQK